LQDDLALLSAAIGALAVLGVDKAARDRLLTTSGAVQLLVQIACMEDEACQVQVKSKHADQEAITGAVTEPATGDTAAASQSAAAAATQPPRDAEGGSRVQSAIAARASTLAPQADGAGDDVVNDATHAVNPGSTPDMAHTTEPGVVSCGHDLIPGVFWPDTVPPLINQVRL
jgi:hypothetical protein